MTNILLSDKSFKKFIENIKINNEQKNFFLSQISQLNEEERRQFFNLLMNIFLLDLEEEKAIEKLNKYWNQN